MIDNTNNSKKKIKENPLKTALVHGHTTKTDIRVITNGKIDMLSSYMMRLTHLIKDVEDYQEVKLELENIVKTLSFIMGIIAGTGKELEDEKVFELMDLCEKHSKPMTFKFVLPGQTLLSSEIHIVRPLTRECELSYAKVYEEHGGSNNIFEYFNKLSTYLYALALKYED